MIYENARTGRARRNFCPQDKTAMQENFDGVLEEGY